MKSLIATMLLVATALTVNSQTESRLITLTKKNIAYMECELKGLIKSPKFDTLKYIYLSFPNTMYSQMKTSVSMGANDGEDSAYILKFITALTKAKTQIGGKEDIIYQEKEYNIYVIAGKKYLSISDAKASESYTKLTAKETDTLIMWLNDLGFK